jgi:hypothetical protein
MPCPSRARKRPPWCSAPTIIPGPDPGSPVQRRRSGVKTSPVRIFLSTGDAFRPSVLSNVAGQRKNADLGHYYPRPVTLSPSTCDDTCMCCPTVHTRFVCPPGRASGRYGPSVLSLPFTSHGRLRRPEALPFGHTSLIPGLTLDLPSTKTTLPVLGTSKTTVPHRFAGAKWEDARVG